MNLSSELSNSEEYQSFRASVPLKKVAVDSHDATKVWQIYDAGPKEVKSPLICLPPVSGTADVFYKQILSLTARGIRVIAVEGPIYWTVDEWCEGFKQLLDYLDFKKVHILGTSLGGFLGQKLAEYTSSYSRVASLILCNSFMDTSIFNYNDAAAFFWLLPGPLLKKLVVGNIKAEPLIDFSIAQSVEFVCERLGMLGQQELASRLTLNCVNCHVDTFKVSHLNMTIIDVFDGSALSRDARDHLSTLYQHAKLAQLKSGGNFPFLSRSSEVNLHIMIHLRRFIGTEVSAQVGSKYDDDIDKLTAIRNPEVPNSHSHSKSTTLTDIETDEGALESSTNENGGKSDGHFEMSDSEGDGSSS